MKSTTSRSAKLRRVSAIVLAGSLVAGLSACEPEPTEAPEQAPPAEPVAPPVAAPAAAPAEPAKDYERPEYPNMARRNPFQPDLEVVQPVDLVAEGDERSLSPLEKYALNQLELVAIISEVAVPKAMFLDPEGFGHVLKEGDRIGQNSGVLSDIRDNEVEVTEAAGEEGNQTRLQTIRLRDVVIRVSDDSGLTDEERAALEKLMETDEGRKAVEERYRKMALGASAVDGEKGSAPPSGQQRTGSSPAQ